MCVSYQLLSQLIARDRDDYWKILKIKLTIDFDFEAIYPGNKGAIIKQDGNDRIIQSAQFGLIPSWSKDKSIYKNMFNARGETISEKPSFKIPFRQKRCLIPVSSFFETNKKSKKKYSISNKDRKLFCFAGIWDEWKIEPIISYSIITTEPNEILKPIHDRMPVILHPDNYETWLNPTTTAEKLKSLLKPYPSEELETVELC